MNPVARKLPPPPPPAVTDARPWSPWADASHTVRKQSTWSASPVATAATALTTEPSCPGSSTPPANQLRFSRSASWISVTPTPENPGGTDMAPG